MQHNPLVLLLDLNRRARSAESLEELAFLLVNDSHQLAPYRQAALWFEAGGIKALSGVVQPEANAPYVHWLNRVCRHLHGEGGNIRPLAATELPTAEAAEWAEWLPPFGLWLPISGRPEPAGAPGGGLLLAADHPWPESSIALLQEWVETWHHKWLARLPAHPWSWSRWKTRLRAGLTPQPGLPWWKQRRLRAAAAVAAVLLFPVRLTVLAHGELVPANPAAIRAPLDGVVGQFHVHPNEPVKKGQPLFGFDEAPIAARLEVAAQAQATAEAEYRQFAQAALSDSKSKAQLAILLGKIEEKRAEADYLRGQFERSRVTAPQDGIALFDDPSEWIGKPVQTGERIMRIAAPGDIEVEAWIPLADAIPVPADADVTLYLAANPLSPVSAHLRYLAHDSVPRPDGTYAYRLRARLDGATDHRIGLKGTAKVHGHWVPLAYWVLRRPLATVRQALGV
ncbi:MAG: HlyD family efflux transporter periplasmic adaptor subunit [Rhodocyclaceae bacterium]|nr:HlyD family efflux transporter periplasmic adaptor subunit [Rhodocyclaceae bacterium]